MPTLSDRSLLLLGYRLPVQRGRAPPSQANADHPTSDDTPIPDYLANLYGGHCFGPTI